MKFEERYLIPQLRKKILLISDDIRSQSGVGNVGREIIYNTSHHFNWVQIAGVVSHPDKGKLIDMSEEINSHSGMSDSSVFLYPVDGYGDPSILRAVIKREEPDAILLITDPRYFKFIFEMEHEIRRKIPIAYLNIWDNFPFPYYNLPYYESCDLLMGISKQTALINRVVLGDSLINHTVTYVPHGIDSDVFTPIDPNDKDLLEYKEKIVKDKDSFVFFFNSRNIKRKQIPDLIIAFSNFLKRKDNPEKFKLLLHTEGVSSYGTDLFEVCDLYLGRFFPDSYIIHEDVVDRKEMNLLYNISDVVVLTSSNEGWGLSLTEAMLAGKPFIANATGGIQDQMGFRDNSGYFSPNVLYPTINHGSIKNHGEWAFPVYPTNTSLQGSPATPYIFEDRCSHKDITLRMEEVSQIDPQGLRRRGLKGREWAVSDEIGFTSKHQAVRIMDSFEILFSEFEPKNKIEIVNTNKYGLNDKLH